MIQHPSSWSRLSARVDRLAGNASGCFIEGRLEGDGQAYPGIGPGGPKALPPFSIEDDGCRECVNAKRTAGGRLPVRINGDAHNPTRESGKLGLASSVGNEGIAPAAPGSPKDEEHWQPAVGGPPRAGSVAVNELDRSARRRSLDGAMARSREPIHNLREPRGSLPPTGFLVPHVATGCEERCHKHGSGEQQSGESMG